MRSNIKTLYVGGIDNRITEQDLRDHFYAHGEIESVRMVLQRACAFVTYTSREAAEKAAEELSNKLVIKGLRLKLLWGRSQIAKAELENHDDKAARQQALAHGAMLPRAVSGRVWEPFELAVQVCMADYLDISNRSARIAALHGPESDMSLMDKCESYS
ncbi:Pre-mrna-splicing factor rbm22 [Thalictrum thalictroides]|uniref:Pre-mrna-splicing factor rbm22 n=1 Tax=Thalictrum thalictroides TaxID=46969 RepID=A0A7J6VFT6_THATH|nr:Pre-mrna-splicing factor rbm22 [Thalictrum thalictroides]